MESRDGCENWPGFKRKGNDTESLLGRQASLEISERLGEINKAQEKTGFVCLFAEERLETPDSGPESTGTDEGRRQFGRSVTGGSVGGKAWPRAQPSQTGRDSRSAG